MPPAEQLPSQDSMSPSRFVQAKTLHRPLGKRTSDLLARPRHPVQVCISIYPRHILCTVTKCLGFFETHHVAMSCIVRWSCRRWLIPPCTPNSGTHNHCCPSNP